MVFRTLAQARAALAAAAEAGAPVILRSAPGAAAHAGVGYLKAIIERARAAYPTATARAIIDCGADAGTALAALRAGWTMIGFSGDDAVAAKLADIAGQSGAVLVAPTSDDRLVDLAANADPGAACRDALVTPGR